MHKWSVQMVTGYKNQDLDVLKLLNSYDWYFLPVANPDGYVYSHKQGVRRRFFIMISSTLGTPKWLVMFVSHCRLGYGGRQGHDTMVAWELIQIGISTSTGEVSCIKMAYYRTWMLVDTPILRYSKRSLSQPTVGYVLWSICVVREMCRQHQKHIGGPEESAQGVYDNS